MNIICAIVASVGRRLKTSDVEANEEFHNEESFIMTTQRHRLSAGQLLEVLSRHVIVITGLRV
jgi:hypothetical protein